METKTSATLVASYMSESSMDDFCVEDGLVTPCSSYYSSCLNSSYDSHTSEGTGSALDYLSCRSYVDSDATSLNPDEHPLECSSSSSTSSTNTTIIHADAVDGPIWMRDMEETSSTETSSIETLSIEKSSTKTSSTETLESFEEVDLNDVGTLATNTDTTGCCFSRVKKKLGKFVQMISPKATNFVPEVLTLENSKSASYDYVKLYEGLF